MLALCSIDGVNWNVVAREALRCGGLARLLAGGVAETSRDGEATRARLQEQLGTLDDRVERARELVGSVEAQVQAQLVGSGRPIRPVAAQAIDTGRERVEEVLAGAVLWL